MAASTNIRRVWQITMADQRVDSPTDVDELIPLGAYWIGETPSLGGFNFQYISPEGLAILARCKTAVLNGWPELESQEAPSNQSIAAAVKAASTVGTKIAIYFDTERVYKDYYTSNYATRRAKMADENWRVYTTGASGTPLNSYFNANGYAVLCTIQCPDDGNGHNSMEWMFPYEASWVFDGAENNTPAPDVDALYVDNLLLFPRFDADWDRDGVTEDNADSTVGDDYREGIASGAARFRALYPTKLLLGNGAEFPNAPGQLGGFGNLTHYNGMCDGLVIEHSIGKTFSPEYFMSTADFVAAIQGTEDAMLSSNFGMFNACPDDNLLTNLKLFRHALCCCKVITDLPFAWCENTEYQDVWSIDFDEYSIPIGPPIEARQTTDNENGIWRRDYEKVIFLWCPRGITGTINLGGTFYVFQGDAAAGRTPGSAVTSITFSSDRDGIMLSRTPT